MNATPRLVATCDLSDGINQNRLITAKSDLLDFQRSAAISA
ncbi:MAG TPA: hypothetical protein PLC99_09505 [Verrucomicrobiota bacterium]|nr:hypothetical protein [Verrucomicrobiota bacterium]